MLVDFHSSFADLMDSLLTLFRISTSDNWSELMTPAVAQAPVRSCGDDCVPQGVDLLKLYNSTGDTSFLVQARELFRGCQTADELNAMREIIACEYPDPDTGLCQVCHCTNVQKVTTVRFLVLLCRMKTKVTHLLWRQSTCGTSELVGYLIFTLFLCCSNFILLNLVMAVLMQELQSAIQSSEKKSKSGLGMLMSVSAATSKWYADSNCPCACARKTFAHACMGACS